MLIPKKNRREVYKYLFKGACSASVWPGLAPTDTLQPLNVQLLVPPL